MVSINLKLNASIRGLLGLSLGTLIGRTDSPARGIDDELTNVHTSIEDLEETR
jgi:hypothetical protein